MKKHEKLCVTWNPIETCLVTNYPDGSSTVTDARYLLRKVFTQEFEDEMKARGYDITSIKFEIAPQIGNEKFVSQRNL